MTKWEYRRFNVDPSEVLSTLATIGLEGWEVVHMMGYGLSSIVAIYCKRPIQEQTT